MQNLIENSQNFIIIFLPHSVRPFYRTVRTVCELVGGQTLSHFMAHIYLACFIYKLELGHDGADMKSWEIQPFIVAEYLVISLIFHNFCSLIKQNLFKNS